MTKLRDVFNEYRDRKFIFIRPGGNIGDHLIYAGAEKLANDLRLNYRTYYCGRYIMFRDDIVEVKNVLKELKKDIDPSDIIYLHGSGAFNSMWRCGNELLKILYNTFPNIIIVGPSSSIIEPGYLKHFFSDDKRIIFFARELTTYEFMKKFFSNVYIDDDTAFNLTKDCTEFKSFCMGIPLKNNHKILILRTDKEKVPLPRAIKKEDCDPILLHNDRKWLELHLWASKITSNRLHSAIFGTIAGKDVELFSNSFHKNRAVWEFSL